MLTIFEFGELLIDMIVLCCTQMGSRNRNKKTHPHRIKVQQSGLIDR